MVVDGVPGLARHGRTLGRTGCRTPRCLVGQLPGPSRALGLFHCYVSTYGSIRDKRSDIEPKVLVPDSVPSFPKVFDVNLANATLND
jgi:hypothetical protein